MPKQANPKIEAFKEYLREVRKPQDWIDDYGESYNKIKIYSREGKHGIVFHLRLDMIDFINRQYSLDIKTDTLGRKYHVLNWQLIQDRNAPELIEYFEKTNQTITARNNDFVTFTRNQDPQFNFNFLRFCNIGDKNGLTITFSNFHTEDSIRLWIVEYERLMKKLQDMIVKPMAREFRGVLTVTANTRIDFNDE